MASAPNLSTAIVAEPIEQGNSLWHDAWMRLRRNRLAVFGMQALGVPIKIENVAGGFILPGDRVDISQSKEVDKPSGEGRMRTTDVIVRNVRVLAIDQATKPADNANTMTSSATATLEVTPDVALALVEAMEQGALHLALKSYNDHGPRSVVVHPRTRLARESIRAITIFSQGETQEVEVRQ